MEIKRREKAAAKGEVEDNRYEAYSDTTSKRNALKIKKLRAPVILGDEHNFKRFGTACIGNAKRYSWVFN